MQLIRNTHARIDRAPRGVCFAILSLFSIVLCQIIPAVAQVPATTETNATPVTPSHARRTPLSESERQHARVWALTETEWQRYRQLMLGIRGSVSDENLSPIEVLGIHARDAAERRHYARLWAESMRADAERVLAFQRAYDAAAKQLFTDLPLIDVGRLKSLPQSTSVLQPGDRVLLFASMKCPACEAMLATLLSYLNTVAGIDIYFTDLAKGQEAQIRTWASAQGIEPGWVQRRAVTLNVDNGLLASISGEQRAAPALFVRRSDGVSVLSYADL